MEDSRLKGYFGTVTHPTLNLERTYCFLCGKPKGWVTKESYEHISAAQIIIICDNCDQQYGKLPLQEADIKEFKESR